MNIPFRPRNKLSGFLGMLYTSLAVCGMGIASAPAQAAVTVDQAPLIVQASLPPNIMLMLDDSGSMTFDVMPDYTSLSDTNGNALINSGINGIYYNPTITYTPPYHANGTTQYTDATFPIAWFNGFKQSDGTVDLTNYSGSLDLSRIDAPSGPGSNYGTGSSITYSTSNTVTTTDTSKTTTQSFSESSSSKCDTKFNSEKSNGAYDHQYTSGRSGGTCLISYHPITSTTYHYFQYSTGSGTTADPYVVHYVANADCGGMANCVLATDATGVSAPSTVVAGTNVANWYSYYHTRILMAKSGLMNAFKDVKSSYRVGFGSINNGNQDDITTLGSGKYTNTYQGKYLAKVQPFGDGKTATDQKNAFWNWVADLVVPHSGTPLRSSLDAVGQYYQNDLQPWSTMSSDPSGNVGKELACRQSYTILTTDGFWNGDDSFKPGDVDDTATAEIQGANEQQYTYTPALPYADTLKTKPVSTTITDSTTKSITSAACDTIFNNTVGATDHDWKKTKSGSRGSPDTGTCSVYTTTTSVVSDGGQPNTLADVAMKYWNTDLRDAINEVPISTEDPAFWQHMTTFTLGMGFLPKGIAPTGTTVPQIFDWADGVGKAIDNFSWPVPTADSVNNIADLAHAAVNGHGGFYSATSPQSFSDGLKDALARTEARTGTGASLAANSTQLDAGTVAYQANYVTATWKGDLKAFSVDSSTGAIKTTSTWAATTELPASSSSSRNIYTDNPAAASTSAGYVAFKVDATTSPATLPALSSAQLTALGSSATAQVDMINYLRGDNSKEESPTGGIFRKRDTPLGDIVNSQPVYVGKPDPNQFYTESFSGLTGDTSFANYASTNVNRTGLLYVAANDGMLHAFDASSGKEVYAYLPGAVITQGSTNGLKDLADPDYGGDVAHEFFNDGEMTVADAYFGSAWHTVLVGTTGRGLARAVYALDITSPAAIKFLWERSASDGKTNSTYIGEMTGKPVIAQTADDTATSTGTWSVLMGNGYNSSAGKAALLQFDIEDGTLTVHATTDTSGLAAPAVWMDPSGNGVSTKAYAGDADGNVWSFALNTSVGTPVTATPSSAGVKLFTAVDKDGAAQPITAGMLAGKDAQTGNIWVFFGTGQYLSSGDLTSLQIQSWYGLVVESVSTDNPAVTSGMTRSANLAQRAITAEQAASGDALAARTVTTAADADSLTGKSGWYIDLKSPVNGAEGERMVTPNQFQGNLLLGTTRIPQATDACNPSGRGWIMAIDPFTGTNPSSNFFDTNGDGVIDSSDAISGTPAAGVGFSSLPNNPIFVGGSMLTSFDNGTTSSIKTSSSTGGTKRVSWRELINQ
jgi:type IV pilus assembly protein PilY1